MNATTGQIQLKSVKSYAKPRVGVDHLHGLTKAMKTASGIRCVVQNRHRKVHSNMPLEQFQVQSIVVG